MDSPARTRNFTTVAFSLCFPNRFAVTDSTPKVHRRHHGGRPCSCRLRSRREQLRSPTPHDKTSYRSRIRNSRTNRQEMVNIPLLVGNAKRQTTDLDCLIDLARRQMRPASKRGMARIGKAVPATVSEGSGGSMPVSHRLVRLGPSRRGRCFADCGLGRHLPLGRGLLSGWHGRYSRL